MNKIPFISKSTTEPPRVNQPLVIEEKTIMTFAEAACWLGISHSTLYKMTSERKLPHYKPGGKRIYFKMEELKSWAFSNRMASKEEILISNSMIGK